MKKMNSKICSRCQKEYPATTEYWRSNKSRFDGLDYYCKSCAKAMGKVYTKSYYAQDRERKGVLGARCPLWTERCGHCLRINTCWRIKDNKRTDWPEKLQGLPSRKRIIHEQE